MARPWDCVFCDIVEGDAPAEVVATVEPMPTDLPDVVRRALYAEAERSPLYVTGAELEQLREAFPPPPDNRVWVPAVGPGEPVTAYPTFYGVRVVVDDVRAGAQDFLARGAVQRPARVAADTPKENDG